MLLEGLLLASLGLADASAPQASPAPTPLRAPFEELQNLEILKVGLKVEDHFRHHRLKRGIPPGPGEIVSHGKIRTLFDALGISVSEKGQALTPRAVCAQLQAGRSLTLSPDSASLFLVALEQNLRRKRDPGRQDPAWITTMYVTDDHQRIWVGLELDYNLKRERTSSWQCGGRLAFLYYAFHKELPSLK